MAITAFSRFCIAAIAVMSSVAAAQTAPASVQVASATSTSRFTAIPSGLALWSGLRTGMTPAEVLQRFPAAAVVVPPKHAERDTVILQDRFVIDATPFVVRFNFWQKRLVGVALYANHVRVPHELFADLRLSLRTKYGNATIKGDGKVSVDVPIYEESPRNVSDHRTMVAQWQVAGTTVSLVMHGGAMHILYDAVPTPTSTAVL